MLRGKKRIEAPLRGAGVGVQTRRERSAEITSGGCYSQQGLTAICKDLRHKVKSVGMRRD
jgi:hypothetical protein